MAPSLEPDDDASERYERAWATMKRRAIIAAIAFPGAFVALFGSSIVDEMCICPGFLVAVAAIVSVNLYLLYPCPRCHRPFTFSREVELLDVPYIPNDQPISLFLSPYSRHCRHFGLRRGARPSDVPPAMRAPTSRRP